jgi:hypothetical protein
METPFVAFDESGNTGADLLNSEQPIFALSSVHFSDDEIREALNIIEPKNVQEIHFKSLRRSSKGKERILKLLRSELLKPEKVKLAAVHKEFLIITKIVDMLVETMAYKDGIDLYEGGFNIALSNLFYAFTPVFCDNDIFGKVKQDFINMIRVKNQQAIDEFYSSVTRLVESCKQEQYKEDLDLILFSKTVIVDVLENADSSDIDPAIPSFVVLCDAWGKQFGVNFDLYHDDSKVISRYSGYLTQLMDKNVPAREYGYDSRTAVFPLKANGIIFYDSRIAPQIQLADIFAGCCLYAFRGLLDSQCEDSFSQVLQEFLIPDLIVNIIWPTTDLVQYDLRSTKKPGINIVEGYSDFLSRQRRNRSGNEI